METNPEIKKKFEEYLNKKMSRGNEDQFRKAFYVLENIYALHLFQDSQLCIVNKYYTPYNNWESYFSPSTIRVENDLCDDPAYSKLSKALENVSSPSLVSHITSVMRRMAERTMTEKEYESILKGKHAALKKTEKSV